MNIIGFHFFNQSDSLINKSVKPSEQNLNQRLRANIILIKLQLSQL